MRFRTKIRNVGLFLKIVTAVEKLSKEAVLHFSPSKLEVIVANDATKGVQMWSSINQQTLFDDYRIESMNNDDVAFLLSTDNLQRALKSAQAAHSIVMKLTKHKGMPVISFTIEIQSQQLLTIIQNVPVVMLSPQQLNNLTEPLLPDPEVFILLPPLRQLQRVVDSMKKLSPSQTLRVHACMNGKLRLSIETDLVTVATFYEKLEHPECQGAGKTVLSDDIEAAVFVDIKKILQFLHCYQVAPTNVICCLLENRAIIMHVIVEDLYMTYYIPALLCDD